MTTPGWLKRRWQKALAAGDAVAVVGGAEFDLTFPNQRRVRSKGVVVVGERSLAFAVDALKRQPINTIRLSRDDAFVTVVGHDIVVGTSQGGSYTLRNVSPFVEVRDALIAGLSDVTDQTTSGKAERAVQDAAGTEQIIGKGFVGYVVISDGAPQLAALAVTAGGIIWCLAVEDAPVLSLPFADLTAVAIDQLLVRFRYQPRDFPDSLRSENPSGELEATFVFSMSPASLNLREQVLAWANSSVGHKQAGEVLAIGEGYLVDTLFAQERMCAERVVAHESTLAVHCSGEPSRFFTYGEAGWFRIEPWAEGRAAKYLGVGTAVMWVSLASGGSKDSWRLAIKSDDLDRWRVILEYCGVAEAASVDSPWKK